MSNTLYEVRKVDRSDLYCYNVFEISSGRKVGGYDTMNRAEAQARADEITRLFPDGFPVLTAALAN